MTDDERNKKADEIIAARNAAAIDLEISLSGTDCAGSPCSAEIERDHYRKILERVLSKLKHHHTSRAGIRVLVENAEGAMGLVSEQNDQDREPTK